VFDKYRSSPYLSLAPALTLILVMLGASLLYAIAESLGFISVIGQSDVSFRAYRAVLAADSGFWVSLAFSLWVSITATLIASAFGLLVAVWLNNHRTQSDTLALNWNLAFPHLVFATRAPALPLPKRSLRALGGIAWLHHLHRPIPRTRA
jgi:ABC-type sugar transport system permease subunit